MWIIKKVILKKTYESGRVKELSDAFNDYSVSEEWHKGKIENLISENWEKLFKLGKVDDYRLEEYKESFIYLIV